MAPLEFQAGFVSVKVACQSQLSWFKNKFKIDSLLSAEIKRFRTGKHTGACTAAVGV